MLKPSVARTYIDEFKDNNGKTIHTNEFYRLNRPENIIQYIADLEPADLSQRLINFLTLQAIKKEM